MNLNEFEQELRKDPEYSETERKLAAHFHFANAVLRARLKKGWTQTELARRVGTRQANISKVEAGLANPTLDLLQRICSELDLQIDFLEAQNFNTPITTSSIRVDDQPNTPFILYNTNSLNSSSQEETWS